MRSDTPWSVKGIDPEARDRAKDLARRSGKTVGSWLSDTIRDHTQAPGRAARHGLEDDDRAAPRRGDVHRRLSDLADHLERLEAATRVRQEGLRRDRSTDDLLDAIADMNQRLAHLGTDMRDATGTKTAELERTVDILAARLDGLSTERRDGGARVDPFDRALDEIAARQRILDDGETATMRRPAAPERAPRPDPMRPRADSREIESIRDDIAALSRSIDGTQKARAPQASDIQALRAEITSMGQMIAEYARPDRLDALTAEVRGLMRVLSEKQSAAASPAGDDVANRLQDIQAAIEMLRDTRGGAGQAELIEEIRLLGRRIERWAQDGTDSKGLAALRSETKALREQVAANSPNEVIVALVGEMKRLSNRIEQMPVGRGPADDVLRTLDGRLAELTKRMEAQAAQRVAGDFEAFETRLDARLAELGRRMERQQTIADDDGFEAFESRLDARLAELAQRMERQQTIADDDGFGAFESRLDARLAELGRRMEQVPAHAEPSLRGIEARLDEILNSLGDPRASAPPADLTALNQRVDRVQQTLEQVESATLRNFETLLAQIAEKIEAVRAEPADPQALESLERQITRLADRLEANETRFAHLGQTEDRIGSMLEVMREAALQATAAAETAAAGAHRALQSAASRSPDLEKVERELSELRGTSEEAEQRLQTTMHAVHSALERIVNRLASMESTPAPQQPARAEPAPRPHTPQRPSVDALLQPDRPAASLPPMPEAAQMPMPASPPAAPHPQQRPPLSRQADIAQARSPVDDLPIEPGSGAPGRMSPGRAAAERIAASEMSLAGIAPPQDPASMPARGNFIAAARRAAQAASEEARVQPPQVALPPRADERPIETIEGSFMSRLRATIEHRKRPIMIGLAGVLALLLALKAADYFLKAPPSTTQKISATIDKAPERKPVLDAAPAAPKPAVPVPAETPAAADVPAPPAAPGPVTEAPPADPDPIGALQAPPGDPRMSMPIAGQPIQLAPPAPAATTVPGALPTAVGPTALRTAALAGDPAATYEVAIRFAEGKGVKADLAEAAKWLDKAVKLGVTPAAYRLGSMYEKGQGVARDPAEASRLYRLAAERGNIRAMHNLAVLYAEGLGGKPDYTNAAEWFRKAADHGLADSQYNVAILYARGMGVPQNLPESYKWFALAAAQGDKDAEKKRDDVAQRLDAQNLAAAKKAVETWRAKQAPEIANQVAPPPGNWETPARPSADIQEKTPQKRPKRG